MIRCNHYKLQDQEFLIYGEKFEVPEAFELVHENVDPSDENYMNLQIIKEDNLNPFIKSVDSILEHEGIHSYRDLANAYFLIKIKKLNKSRRVRELVLQKYQEVVDLIHLEDGSTENGRGGSGNTESEQPL